MKLFVSILVLATLFLYTKSESRLHNRSIVPYNAIIGYASTNVVSYSKGNDSHAPGDSYCLYKVYTGIKWQCVEFACRCIFLRKGCVFHQITEGLDIWSQVDSAQRVVETKCFNFKKFPNGSPSPPKNETFIIFDRSSLSVLVWTCRCDCGYSI